MKKTIAALLALALLFSLAACSTPTESQQPNATTAPTKPTEPLPEIYNRKSYTGTAEDMIAHRSDVVATFGDAKLTNGLLQMYYWMDVYNFLNSYRSDLLNSSSLHGNSGHFQQHLSQLLATIEQAEQAGKQECPTGNRSNDLVQLSCVTGNSSGVACHIADRAVAFGVEVSAEAVVSRNGSAVIAGVAGQEANAGNDQRNAQNNTHDRSDSVQILHNILPLKISGSPVDIFII